ncbi:MAG: PspC domain-containing protein [Acidobacteriota bacterium]|nr:PspC domain-containing protein [Acidobacteriota bacterium]
MFCTQCGTSLDDQARYCTMCGKSTALAPQPEAPPAGYYGTAAPPRRLRRIMARKKISGVCAGFAEYFDMDVTLMRLIWLGLALAPPNIGIIGYIIAIFVLPKE